MRPVRQNQDMSRKKPIPDPRAAERASHLGIALYPDDSARFEALLTASGLTRSGWVRGAIRAAAADSEIAAAIAEVGDKTAHGGARPGAGRPRKASDADESVQDQEGT